MPVEFLGIAATNDGSEITARSGPAVDPDRRRDRRRGQLQRAGRHARDGRAGDP